MDLTTGEKRHIEAAVGWLELGQHVSAFEELEELPAATRAHPKVLKIRHQIFAKAEKWLAAFDVADGLTQVIPNDPEPFVWRADAARRMPGGSVEMALQLLLEASVKFDEEPVIPFNLARYNCQLGKLVEARSWLHIAFEVAAERNATRQWKLKAIDDKDLEPLWDEIRKSG